MSDSRDQVIKNQRTIIKMHEKKIEELTDKLNLMKSLVMVVSKEWNIEVPPMLNLNLAPQRMDSWSDKSERFGRVRSQLLEAVLSLAQKNSEPLHQNMIIEEARKIYGNLRYIDESTLTARLREMRNPMGLLIGYPELPQGYYYPSKKTLELKT